MEKKIFRKESLERISSPEQMNDYVRVCRPSVWLVLAAGLLLLAGFLVWSFTYSLETKLTVTGLAEQGKVVCYLPPDRAAEISEGMEVRLDGGSAGRVSKIASLPLSYDETAALISGDYIKYALGLGEWNVEVVIECEQPPADGELTGLSIVQEKVKPGFFLFN